MIKIILLVCLLNLSLALNDDFSKNLWRKFKLNHGESLKQQQKQQVIIFLFFSYHR